MRPGNALTSHLTDYGPPMGDSTPHITVDDQRRAHHAKALDITASYVLTSAGAGLIPLPGLDVTVLAGIHLSLIKALAEHYGHSFSEHGARNIMIAVAASLLPGTLGSLATKRVLMFLPLGLSSLTQSVASGAVSYALGRVIIAHFESGGDLDSFDVKDLHKLAWWRPNVDAAAVS